MKYIKISLLTFIYILLIQYSSYGQKNTLKVMNAVKEGQYINLNSWLIDINGDTLNYKTSFKGKWLLIDYWTTGCRPCIKEFPALNDFYKSIDSSKLEIITLSVDQTMSRWKKGVKRYQIDIPKYYAGQVPNNHFLTMNYMFQKNEDNTQTIVTLTPQYMLINPEGKIVEKKLPKPSSKEFDIILKKHIEKY